jgi:hypothetical protein
MCQTNKDTQTENVKKCERCGKEDDSVSTGINPYIRAMSNEEVEITVCDDCYSDLVMSV